MYPPLDQPRPPDPKPFRPHDERLGTLQLGLVATGAYFTWLAKLMLPWETEPLVGSARFHVILIPAITVALMALLALLGNRPWLRRSMALSMLISLVLHVSMLAGLAAVVVFGHVAPTAPVSDQKVLADILVPLPVYEEQLTTDLSDTPEPQQPWERPVSTDPAAADVDEIARLEMSSLDLSASSLTSSSSSHDLVPELPDELQRQELPSAPRLSQLPNILSRSRSTRVPESSSAARGADIQPIPASPSATELTEQDVDVSKSAASPSALDAPELDESSPVETSITAARLDIQRSSELRTDTMTSSSQAARLPRSVLEPRATPRAALPLGATASPPAVVERRLDPSPADSGISRQPSATPARALAVVTPETPRALEPEIRMQRQRSEDLRVNESSGAFTGLVARSDPISRPQLTDSSVAPPTLPAGSASAAERTVETPLEAQPSVASRTSAAALPDRPASTVPSSSISPAESMQVAAGSSLADVRRPDRQASPETAPPLPAVPREGSSSRQVAAPSVPVGVQAEVPNLSGLPSATGEPAGQPLQASRVDTGRSLSGAPTTLAAQPLGTQASSDIQVGTIAPDVRPAPSRPNNAVNDGSAELQVVSSDAVGRPAPRAEVAQAPRGVRQPVRLVIPGINRDDEDAPSSADNLVASQLSTGRARGDYPASVVVVNQRDKGPGGLGTLEATDTGMLTRRAQEESQVVSTASERFVRRTIARPLPADTAVVNPAEAYRRRAELRSNSNADGQPGGGLPSGAQGPRTEASIELGLAYLASQQRSDGRWTLAELSTAGAPSSAGPTLRSDTAATGLALLSFLGAGYHHRDFKYSRLVDDGLTFLLERQTEEGDFFAPEDPISNRSVWMYSHAIATLAVCEAYGMTRDPKLRGSAEAALRFIELSQHPERGGWRYAPVLGTDTSVTGWMMMALKSGELADLPVDPETYKLIDQWLDRAELRVGNEVRYAYNPFAVEEQRHGREASIAMTAVGGLMRMYSGWDRRRAELRGIGDYLLENPPELGTEGNRIRDTYYWYYATQVMFHLGGDYWERWNQQLHPLLIDSQLQAGDLAGSWDPLRPVPDKWAGHAGRLYVTTMNLLSLEVTYRHLPLYENTGR